MRLIIALLASLILLVSCGQNFNKEKELELKEKELALKEKELILKYGEETVFRKDSIDTKIETTKTTTEIEQKIDLPFVGTKEFETRPGISGRGTPNRYIEITENGDVYFGFEQVNQADGTVTEERYYSGKFKPYMKCIFKKWGNEITYYRITKNKIYEVDKNNKLLTGEDCCSFDNSDLEDNCPCESDYF